MNIEQEYKEKTGKDAWAYANINMTTYYTVDFVEWLKDKVSLAQEEYALMFKDNKKLVSDLASLTRRLEVAEKLKSQKIITLCGSSRYCDIMAVCSWLLERDEGALTMGLHLLPEWYCKGKIPDHLAEHENCATEMDALHLKKIDISDEIFVVNYEDYIGKSTTREIEYAKSKNKKIRWYTHDEIGEKVDVIIHSIIAEEGKK